jgi:hypothetical protein
MNTGVIIIIIIVVLFLYFNSSCTQKYENMELQFDHRYYAINNPTVLSQYWKPEKKWIDKLPDKLPENCLPEPFPESLKKDLYNHWQISGSLSNKPYRFCSDSCPSSNDVTSECPLHEDIYAISEEMIGLQNQMNQ